MDSGFHLEPRRILDFISLLPPLSQSFSVWRLQTVVPPLCAVPSWKGTLICEFQQLWGLDCSRAPSPAIQGLLRPLPASLLLHVGLSRFQASTCWWFEGSLAAPAIRSNLVLSALPLAQLLILHRPNTTGCSSSPAHIWVFMGFLLANFVVEVAYGFFGFPSWFLHLFPQESLWKFKPSLTLVPWFCFYFEDLAHVCISEIQPFLWIFWCLSPSRKSYMYRHTSLYCVLYAGTVVFVF